MHDFDSEWPPVHNSFTYYLYSDLIFITTVMREFRTFKRVLAQLPVSVVLKNARWRLTSHALYYKIP